MGVEPQCSDSPGIMKGVVLHNHFMVYGISGSHIVSFLTLLIPKSMNCFRCIPNHAGIPSGSENVHERSDSTSRDFGYTFNGMRGTIRDKQHHHGQWEGKRYCGVLCVRNANNY